MYPTTAITGIGVISSLSFGFKGLWNAFVENTKTYSPLDKGSYFNMENHNICPLKEGLIKLHPKEARIMGRHSLMLIKASEEASFEGKLEDYQDEDKGYFAALGMVDYKNEDLLPAVIKSLKEDGEIDYNIFFKKGYLQLYPLWPLSMLNNIALCQSAIRLSIRGDNCVFSPHSDSSLQAIHEASRSIGLQQCQAALAGAVSESISPLSLVRYVLRNHNKGRLTSNNPSGGLTAITPMAEGAAIFALERPVEAQKRGLKTYALVAGFGSSFAFDRTCGGPAKEAVMSSIRQSLQAAQVKSSEIDIVFSHYDIDAEEGINEKGALEEIFGNHVKIVSSKKHIGDMLSAAGAFDVALATAIMHSGHEINCALINAFSVEGNTTSIVLRRQV